MVLVGLFAGSMLAASMSLAFEGASVMGGTMFTVIYVLLAALWFFPCLYLFRFATNMQHALNNNEQDKLITSFQNLKSHYRFIGILIIIMLAFYAIAIIGGIIAAATMGLS
jgi:amino acid transporter